MAPQALREDELYFHCNKNLNLHYNTKKYTNLIIYTKNKTSSYRPTIISIFISRGSVMKRNLVFHFQITRCTSITKKKKTKKKNRCTSITEKKKKKKKKEEKCLTTNWSSVCHVAI